MKGLVPLSSAGFCAGGEKCTWLLYSGTGGGGGGGCSWTHEVLEIAGASTSSTFSIVLHVSEVDLVSVCQYRWAVKYHCVLEKDINYKWSKWVVSMPTFSSHRKAGFQSTTREAVLFGCIWVSSLRMCHDDFTLPATMHKPLYLFPSQLTLLCNKGLKPPCCTSGSNLNQSTPGLRASQDSGHADWIQDVVVESLSIMRVIPAGAAFLTMMRSHDIWGWQGPANAVVGCWVWWLNFCQSIPRMTQHQTITQGGLGQWLVNPMT